jgi:hypothetical protein
MKLLAVFLLLTASLFASETRDLERTTKIWQNKLGMAHWSIVIKPVPKIILENLLCPEGKSECLAVSKWDVHSQSGMIFVMMRDDYTKEMKKQMKLKSVKADQRDSVVHEMLHNLWAHMEEEHAMWVLSHALKP